MDGGMGRGVGGDGRQAFLGGVGLYRYASDFNASFRRHQSQNIAVYYLFEAVETIETEKLVQTL